MYDFVWTANNRLKSNKQKFHDVHEMSRSNRFKEHRKKTHPGTYHVGADHITDYIVIKLIIQLDISRFICCSSKLFRLANDRSQATAW